MNEKINKIISLAEEQQGFRSRKFCTDAMFGPRQIIEKSIEYNKPAYLCFDLRKAFDRIQLQDVVHILYNREIPAKIIFTQRIKSKHKLTKAILVNCGI
ncbi:hypothetical protein P5V15_005938 [Pogonomyrmex californicus]